MLIGIINIDWVMWLRITGLERSKVHGINWNECAGSRMTKKTRVVSLKNAITGWIWGERSR